jgi:hypothetical protein
MSESKFPRGWDAKRVQDLIDHYDAQTEDEEAAEIEEGLEAEDVTWIAVPKALVGKIQALIAREQSA